MGGVGMFKAVTHLVDAGVKEARTLARGAEHSEAKVVAEEGARTAERTAARESEKAVTIKVEQGVAKKNRFVAKAVAALGLGAAAYAYTHPQSEEEKRRNERDPLGFIADAVCEGLSTATGGSIPCEWTQYLTPALVGITAYQLSSLFSNKLEVKLAVAGGSGGAYYVFREGLIF